MVVILSELEHERRSGQQVHTAVMVTAAIWDDVAAQGPADSKCSVNPSCWGSAVITTAKFSKPLTCIFHTHSKSVQLNSVFFE